MPTFWLGLILLVVFGSGTVGSIPAIFPAGGMQTHGTAGGLAPSHILDVAWHLVLPCLTLVAVIFAQYVTIMRSSIIDERGNPYLLTARAKGLRDDDVRRQHAVPNALLPSVTVIFLQIGGMIGGAITVEIVYSWPGPRLPHVHRAPHPRPAAARGHLHRLQRLGDPVQPDRRHALPRPRPEGEAPVSTTERTPKRTPRRPGAGRGEGAVALGAGAAASWCRSCDAQRCLVGVLVMVGFIVMALTAPLFIHPSDLNVTKATGPAARATAAPATRSAPTQPAARCCTW